MSLALMLVLQTAVPAPAPAVPVPIDFDLARLPREPAGPGLATRACDRPDPSAIVVCGRRGGGLYPLDEMAAIFVPGPVVAEAGLAGPARIRAYVETMEFAPGLVSNRLMVGIRLPF